MEIIYTLSGFSSFRSNFTNEYHPVGLVPTMGALHEGHLSLVEKAQECKKVLVSIFVNPNQFNDPRDLENYPRNIERDLELLKKYKVDAVFIPEVKDIYPEPDTRQFDFGNLDKVMEGAHRPGHFNGVAQVVSRLFDIIKPDRAYFGQKDFQQLSIIQELVRQLKYNTEIVPCPIIREPDGLAMSSRNELLSKEERSNAAKLNKILFKAREQRKHLDVEELKSWAMQKLVEIPMAEPEYFEIVDVKSLIPIKSWDHKGPVIACLAVKINRIRLIDNLIFN